MKIRLGIFAFLFLLIAIGLYGEERTHLVQRGETFFSIARSFGVSVDDLMRHNGITDPSRLQAGLRLRIPGTAGSGSNPAATAAPAAAPAVATYRVVRGDTLFSIARRHEVTVASLRAANGLAENHVLREGQVLRLPPEARAPVAAAPPPARPPAAPAPARVEPRGTETRPVNPSITWPINAREISYMTGKLRGVVITGERGEPVRSLTRGTVISAGPFQGFGRVVIVQVEGGYLYVYGGNETLSVTEGDRVGPGTELGRLGIDPVSNRPQLFFMVYRNNVSLDPATAPRG